jgi:hypothetical protein
VFATEKADNKGMDRKRPASLKANIDKILNGTQEEKKALKRSYFFLAETPLFMKEIRDIDGKGLTGDYFTARYGVISRHVGKDPDHDLTAQNWTDLCDAIKAPFAIVKHGDGYNLFTNVQNNTGKWVMVAVDVKNAGRNIEVNSIKTAYGYKKRLNGVTDDFVYVSPKITPEQTALLDGANYRQYLSARKGGSNELSTLSPTSPEMSSPTPQNCTKK